MKECSTCIFCYVDKEGDVRREVYPSYDIAKKYKQKYSNLVVASYKSQVSDIRTEYVVLSCKLYCRRYPPSSVSYVKSDCYDHISTSKYSEFPEVEPAWFCGEYKRSLIWKKILGL